MSRIQRINDFRRLCEKKWENKWWDFVYMIEDKCPHYFWSDVSKNPNVTFLYRRK